MKTNLQIKLKSLKFCELVELAEKIDSSVDYLNGHIYHARRVPKKQLMSSLQSELCLTDEDMYQHFYKN